MCHFVSLRSINDWGRHWDYFVGSIKSVNLTPLAKNRTSPNVAQINTTSSQDETL
jgi:hypothetical protein